MKAELKIKALNTAEIADAVGGRAVSFGGGAPSACTSIATGSNEVTEGALFVAIKGSRVDGHTYIADAIGRGAVCAIADHIPEGLPEGRYDIVLVDDTVAALGKLSAYYRTLAKIKTVAVTGSVGKTTTKEFVYSALSGALNTEKTEGNHNNEIGMPLTLMNLSPETETAVLEMGMSAFGEISYLSKIAKPDIGVITNIGTAHLEALGTRENICKAKMEITDGMAEGATLFVNGDEPLLTAVIGSLDKIKAVTYGFRVGCDIRVVNLRHDGDGMVFDIMLGERLINDVRIPTIGNHNVLNATAAYAVAREMGIADGDIRLGLASFVNTGMRQKIYPVGNTTVIEDCYNASPESMRASMDVLAEYAKGKGARPTALLGDMLELGENSEAFHRGIGAYAASLGVKRLYCFGEMASFIADESVKSGVLRSDVFLCRDTDKPEAMADILINEAKSGDVILAKASRGISLERVIEKYRTAAGAPAAREE